MDSNLVYQYRQDKIRSLLKKKKFEALILNPGPTLIYLTGLAFHLMERPILTIFTPQAPPFLVLPELEAAKLGGLSYEVNFSVYGEDPSTWNPIFTKAIRDSQIKDKSVAIEPTRLRVLEYQIIEKALPANALVPGDDIIAELRMIKDKSEISAMRKAVEIAQQALTRIEPLIRPGITEKQLASQLTLELIRAGSDPVFPFSPIVSSGPNSANPHASPTNRMISPGDVLVIDWGASYDGYLSDITRSFAIGNVDAKLRQIAEIVERANRAGRSVIKPGNPASDVDVAARQVIEQAGYGSYFIHRTGHGIGMESHEPPYIRADNPQILKAGMTFTVEPGIYLPDLGGVRIEDDIVVTDAGAESLSDLPRELIIVEV